MIGGIQCKVFRHLMDSCKNCYFCKVLSFKPLYFPYIHWFPVCSFPIEEQPQVMVVLFLLLAMAYSLNYVLVLQSPLCFPALLFELFF